MMRWVRLVACMIYTKCWLGNLKGRDHLGDLGRDVKILK
jgi:hypothetical protein